MKEADRIDEALEYANGQMGENCTLECMIEFLERYIEEEEVSS